MLKTARSSSNVQARFDDAWIQAAQLASNEVDAGALKKGRLVGPVDGVSYVAGGERVVETLDKARRKQNE